MKNVIYEVVKDKNTIESMLETLAIFNPDFITSDDKIEIILYGMADLYNYERKEINVDYVTEIFREDDFIDDDFLNAYDARIKSEYKTLEEVIQQITYSFSWQDRASHLIDLHYEQISHLVSLKDKVTIQTMIFQELLSLIYGFCFDDKLDVELYSLAYDKGHAYGYSEVESNLISMLKLHAIHHNVG